MPHSDFDIDSLAVYLHLTPPQVRRLADRDRVPGRKVGGEWRFSRAEIHHWLEAKMGVFDDGELERLETSLGHAHRRAAPHDLAEYTIEKMLPLDAIAVPLPAKTRASVITAMTDLADATGMLWDAAALADAVRAREDLYSTANENGVALLHPRRPLPAILEMPFIAFGRTDQGIPFGASGGGLTDLFVLIASTSDAGHLRTLARLARLLDADCTSELRGVNHPHTVHEILVQRERQLGDV